MDERVARLEAIIAELESDAEDPSAEFADLAAFDPRSRLRAPLPPPVLPGPRAAADGGRRFGGTGRRSAVNRSVVGQDSNLVRF